MRTSCRGVAPCKESGPCDKVEVDVQGPDSRRDPRPLHPSCNYTSGHQRVRSSWNQGKMGHSLYIFVRRSARLDAMCEGEHGYVGARE